MTFPIVARGAKGPYVATLQTLLGFPSPDGDFGGQTEVAVKTAQLFLQIPQSGICDGTTWERIVATLAPYRAPCACPPGARLPSLEAGYIRQHSFSGSTWAVDLPTPTGTQIEAPCAGRVSRVSDRSDPYNGIGVWIEPRSGPLRQIALIHLSALAVEVDQEVAPGQLLGLSGNTGASKAPHLHLEVAAKLSPLLLDPLALFQWKARGWT